MLLNIDAKQIEWVVALYYSQDEVGIGEWRNGFDQHADNQKRFGLPERVIAKIMLFRIIYGGDGYSFSVDPEFGHLGSQRWWDERITQFYEKYKGLYQWHQRLFESIIKSNGRLDLPTGRGWTFECTTDKYGNKKWPRTKILNYPVQGTAGDLISIARVSLHKRLRKLGLLDIYKFVNTVHDSIVLDISDDSWDNIGKVCEIVNQVFEDIPKNFESLFGVEFNLPIRAEITIGNDWQNMIDWQKAVNQRGL